MRWRTRGASCAAVMGIVLAVAAIGAAEAQQSESLKSEMRSLSEQVERLRRDLSETQRRVYGDDFVPREATAAAPARADDGAAAPNGATALAAQNESQIRELQAHLAAVTGSIEEAQHQLDGLAGRLDKLVADVDHRLAIVERELAARQAAAEPATDTTLDAASGAATAPEAETAAAPQEIAPVTEAGTALPADESEAAGGGSSAPAEAASALPAGNAAEQYDYAFGLLARGDYDAAQRALQAFITAHPDDPLSGNAQYWLGETHYVREDFASAAAAFLAGYQRFPDGDKAPDNLLKLAMTLGTLGQKADACATLDQLAQRHPTAAETLRQRADRERATLACR
ncbi:MAG: tol-pal system protein YbgF [Alphaproteobacteria bacterium]|nr:tol-pal system protein YbgF [Alphaproteobacteria bacterium]